MVWRDIFHFHSIDCGSHERGRDILDLDSASAVANRRIRDAYVQRGDDPVAYGAAETEESVDDAILDIDLAGAFGNRDPGIAGTQSVEMQTADDHSRGCTGVYMYGIGTRSGNESCIDSRSGHDRRGAIDDERTITSRGQCHDFSVGVGLGKSNGKRAARVRHCARRSVRAADRNRGAIVLSNDGRSDKKGHENAESDTTHGASFCLRLKAYSNYASRTSDYGYKRFSGSATEGKSRSSHRENFQRRSASRPATRPERETASSLSRIRQRHEISAMALLQEPMERYGRSATR